MQQCLANLKKTSEVRADKTDNFRAFGARASEVWPAQALCAVAPQKDEARLFCSLFAVLFSRLLSCALKLFGLRLAVGTRTSEVLTAQVQTCFEIVQNALVE